MNDFSNYKFRCSGLPYLLTDPRSKSEALSETTKTYLRELWIQEMFNREKLVSTKYMTKGIACETDSLELFEQVNGKRYFKNKKELENDHLKGTPDVIDSDLVIDIKTSWDIWTFASVDESTAKKTYYGQLLGYMILTGKDKAQLAYCLVNTPEEQISYEMYKLKVSGAIKDTEEDETRARANFIFDDIDPKLRIKVFDFQRDIEVENKLIERIEASREFMNNLSL